MLLFILSALLLVTAFGYTVTALRHHFLISPFYALNFPYFVCSCSFVFVLFSCVQCICCYIFAVALECLTNVSNRAAPIISLLVHFQQEELRLCDDFMAIYSHSCKSAVIGRLSERQALIPHPEACISHTNCRLQCIMSLTFAHDR